MPRVSTGRIFKRGDVWWIDYSHRGKRYRESSESTKQNDARTLLKKRMAEMGQGKVIGPDRERATFDELAEAIKADYEANERKSTRRLQSSLRHLRRHFGGDRAADITEARLKRYIADRRAEGAANSTIQKELAAIKRAFRVSGFPQPPAVPSVRVSNTREGFFDAGDLERVIAELPNALRPVVRFASLTGWRKGEILSLMWSQVDFNAGVVRLASGTTKNEQGRELPFRALPALERVLEGQREATRAVEKSTGKIVSHVFHRDGVPIKSMRDAWAGACKRAGMDGWLFHDLRRTAVRNLERAGVSRSVAMKVTGHKTESVYRRYAITDRRAMEEGLAKLADLDGGESKVVPIREAAEG